MNEKDRGVGCLNVPSVRWIVMVLSVSKTMWQEKNIDEGLRHLACGNRRYMSGFVPEVRFAKILIVVKFSVRN